MNILFVTIAWPQQGERNLYSDLMDEFVRKGHIVNVICADENTSVNSLFDENNINVLRISTLRIRKANKYRKAIALSTLGFKLEQAINKYWSDKKYDLIISNSPPVTLSCLLKTLKRKYHAPLYYLLKDIWPHGPADLNFLRKKSVIFFYFRLHEKWIYKTADFIGCMSPMNVEYILRMNKFLANNKVEVCPNSIRPRNLMIKSSIQSIRRKYKIPESSIVFIFSGNIGRAHGLNFYLDAIEKLKELSKAYFLIGGSGQYYNYVVHEIARRKLSNIGTYYRLPPDDFDQLMLACDVGVILLDPKYTVPQFPSRMLSYLEAKKPILCSVNKATDIGKIIEEARCGFNTLNGDLDSFTAAVKYFCNEENASAMVEMGNNAFALLNEQYSVSVSYSTIMKHFKDYNKT